MDNQTAAKLVERIVGTWPTGPKGFVWTEHLTPLEPGPASEAYRQLAATEQRITVAQYMTAYHNQLGSHERHQPPASCNHCDHGWTLVNELHNGHLYEMTTPCTCPAGQTITAAHRRIVTDNDTELYRLFPGRAPSAAQLELITTTTPGR